MKAVKFGGTSMSTAESIKTVKRIVESDPERRFIVVSAPGVTTTEAKVTDVLISVAERKGADRVNSFATVKNRFIGICNGLGLEGFLDGDFRMIETVLPNADDGYIISRGEYLCAKLAARFLGYPFVDAAGIIKFHGGVYDDDTTETVCAPVLNGYKCAVIPGFYGSDEQGKTVIFPRGGSDISGAIVARAVNASVYENFTDVDGFMTSDPRVVPHAEPLDLLTYMELRELAYMGANVLHPESIFPARRANIPIHILNTFNAAAHGTMIVPTELFLSGKYKRKRRSVVTAVAGKRHFSSLYIDKSMTYAEVGFIRRVLGCFESLNIHVEHISSGIDSVTVVFSARERETADRLMCAVKKEVSPDRINLTTDVSLIAIVGHGMCRRRDVVARAVNRLSNADINLLLIDRSASEINIILAVSDNDFERALIALNGEFEI
ncbi:MAG: aspartate kinase [Clostridiales bacterium]|nr:aspartate kinase [Clostridiales bacterium]